MALRYHGRVTATSDRAFFWLLTAAALPAGAVAFALSRATHDIQLALADGPAPVAGLCRDALSYTLSPLAHVSYIGFGTLAVASTGLGLLSLLVSIYRTRRRIGRDLRTVRPVPASLRRRMRKAGLSRTVLVESAEPRAFTFGYLRPTVAITTALIECLGEEELEAVLHHEAAHVRRRDPLRALVVGSLARAFVFAPLLGELARRFQAAKEMDADADVIAVMGSRRALVSALLQVEESPQVGAVAPFAGMLEARLASLEGEQPFPRERRRLLPAFVSAATVLGMAAGLFVITTGAVDAHVLHVCSG